jgi:GAF domain-containing protein
VLGSSLDLEATLERVANLAVLELADMCSVYLVEAGNHLRQVAVAALDPAKARLLRILGTEYLPNLEESDGSLLRRAVQSQRPQLVAAHTEDLLTAGAHDVEHLRLRRELGLHTRLAVPLVARDRVLGGMVLGCTQSDRHFGPPECQLAEELARRAAAAVDNARLYHAEQEARRAAERAVERMTRLQAVTATLAQPFNLPDAAARIVDEVRAALGAQAGAVIRLIEDGSVFEVVHEAGYRGDTAAARQMRQAWRRFPAGS